jgi:pimeloyl-ACP methyl ester carboxylesterase
MRERAPARGRAAAALFGVALLAAAGAAEQPLPSAGWGEAPPERWRLGQLELRACTVGAQPGNGVPSQAAYCADFPVPEDWGNAAGRQILLRVAVVPALAAEAERDLVAFLDGGPGGAATQDYPEVAHALAPLRQHRHLLLVDQRGTGSSNPLDCAPAQDGAEADAGAGRGAPAARADLAAQVERIRRCARRLAPRAAPQFYATVDAVRDLEAVRQALGAPPLDLVGVSYGTRVAQQYARRYPAAVRSVVLDSPVPNRLVLMAETARNLEDVVQARLARCRADRACFRRYGDPYAILKDVQAQLRRQPQMVETRDPQSFAPVRRSLGADELAALVRIYAYSDATSALLPYVISEAQAGRYAPLLAQAQLVARDLAARLNGGMAASVICAEDAERLQDRPQDADTLLGATVAADTRRACEAWPHRPSDAAFHEPFRAAVPVLVLAGELDPVTPPRYGEEIVHELARARLLRAPGQGHAVLGIGCMPRLVEAFVAQPDPARLDERCLQRLGPVPVFLDVNGAPP